MKIKIIPVPILSNIADEASEWCAYHWGRSIIFGEIIDHKTTFIDGTSLLIPTTNVWVNLQKNEWCYLNGTFYFKDDKKALEFKLRWAGR